MTIPIKFRFVVATRETTEDFWSKTATGRSLSLYQTPIVELALFPENSSGLSAIYNEVIEKSKDDPAILIFADDDLHILDFHWMNTIFNGLKFFDIVGFISTVWTFVGRLKFMEYPWGSSPCPSFIKV